MTLKVHHLRPAPGAHTPKTRVGRGEGSKGKTAGRGTKGTGARGNTSARFEGGQTPLHMRLPKLSGFKNNNKIVFQVVNLDRIAALFPQGGSINPDSLAPLHECGAGWLLISLDRSGEGTCCRRSPRRSGRQTSGASCCSPWR
jgi:ribosomal protein L15